MRKQPRQQRSQQMVADLVEACARVIARDGLARLSTNLIAAEAGVSVGSLYQYFASKEALVEALLDRMSQALADLVRDNATALLADDVHTAVERLLQAVFAFIDRNANLHLELARHWQDLRTLKVVDEMERHLFDFCRLYLLRHLREIPIDNPLPTLYVVINSALMTIIRFMSHPHPPLTRSELIGALSDMFAAYMASLAQAK
ncbi:TetR/AcrR family transcriptional regulator [Aquipseudomonas alcaligenes]